MPRQRREPPVIEVVIGLDGPLSEVLLRAARARRRKPVDVLADVVETVLREGLVDAVLDDDRAAA